MLRVIKCIHLAELQIVQKPQIASIRRKHEKCRIGRTCHVHSVSLLSISQFLFFIAYLPVFSSQTREVIYYGSTNISKSRFVIMPADISVTIDGDKKKKNKKNK